MNIGFYRYSILNRGGDRIIVEYANHLAESGHVVMMYARRFHSQFKLSSKVHIARIPYPGKPGTLLYGAVHNLKHDLIIVDIIHMPLALSIRNAVLYFAQADDREYYHAPLLRRLIHLLYAIHFRSGKPVITVSERLTQVFARDYDFHNSITVNNGIDHTIFYPDQDKDLITQKNGRRAVVFMSRGDTYRKGHDIALQVFRSIDMRTALNMELWVCGNHFDGSGFPFTTRNFGSVSDTRLRRILSSADIFFYPSRHEGFGLFPLEAMACGCVAITTDAIPYARQTKSILVSPIADVQHLKNNLSMLVNEEAVFLDMKRNVVQVAGRYDLTESKIAFENALQSILTSRN